MRKLLLTGIAALLMATSAYAQQGNLPKPGQKLPAYPPVVCVAPNWATEPCENRQPKQAFEGPAVQTFEGLLPPPFGPINKGWVGSEHGGNLQEHVERWKALAASGKDVEIRGFCLRPAHW